MKSAGNGINFSGARFRRADLHIHSFGENASFDVMDSTMTPEAIIDTAIEENLEVIAIADHNRIGNVSAAVDYSDGKKILVIPAVELSTREGHLLVYFASVQNLNNFMGKLSFDQDYRMCNHTIPQCLEEAAKFGGIGIAAHIELNSGFEVAQPKYDHFKQEIVCHPNLFAFEITKLNAVDWFTNRDDSDDRKRLFRARRDAFRADDHYEVAKVMNSDAHSLSALGKNANNARKLTRLKMDALTFDSFRIALLDPVARIRLEDQIPERTPHFLGISLEGGFLDSQGVRFSSNLNCIIGGRGTGKSTFLESLRVASGNTGRDSLIDSEVWPEKIVLEYEDEAGQRLTFSRSSWGGVINQTDPQEGITQVPIESYGQGETAETIQHCGKDPRLLLEFLDQFVDLSLLEATDKNLRDELLANQTQIEQLTLEVAAMPETKKAKQNAQQQVALLKKQEAAKVVEIEEKLSKGSAFRQELNQKLAELFKIRSEAFSDKSLSNLVDQMDGSQLVVGGASFESVKGLVDGFEQDIESLSEELKQKSKAAIAAVEEELKKWRLEEANAQNEIDTIRKELESNGVKLDMAFIKKVTEDVNRYETKLRNLNLKKDELQKVEKERTSLLRQRKTARTAIYNERLRFSTRNNNLNSTVLDFNVKMSFEEGRLSQEAEAIVKDAMGWRTSQVPKAALICSQVPPLELSSAAQKKDINVLLGVADKDGNNIFSQNECVNILDALAENSVRFRLERCEFDDIPTIQVSKKMEVDGSVQYRQRGFDRLSLGNSSQYFSR